MKLRGYDHMIELTSIHMKDMIHDRYDFLLKNFARCSSSQALSTPYNRSWGCFMDAQE